MPTAARGSSAAVSLPAPVPHCLPTESSAATATPEAVIFAIAVDTVEVESPDARASFA